ncbi:cation-translocating P-type ATPase [Candidatus Thorarchaeota archaeon]|nr:MAG: cation-translocating P-type ATPase [Candidatus Thorarchaeota archaeon]
MGCQDFGCEILSAKNEWFKKSPEEVLQSLNSSTEGLTNQEAEQRLLEYGPNELEELGRIGPLRMFLQQFTNPMVVILLFAIIISIAISSLHGSHESEGIIDAIVISAIVMINAIFGFVQEYRSEKALEALKDLSAPKAVVKRNGEWEEIEASQIVPGDVISLESGDIVPADARLLTVVGLSTDESALTGESVAVQKTVKAISSEKSALGDLTNLLFQGSVVTSGKGTAVITSTGMKTEFGKIAQLVQESERELTPLQRDLDDLGKKLGVVVLLLSFLIFISLVFINATYDWNEALFVSIAIAVAAIPEGLPAVVTVTLAIGVSRMVKRNAIVRRLPSVETLGSTTVICSDKTGTITKNEMTVRYIYLSTTGVAITGTGYSSKGEFYNASAPASCTDLSTIKDPFDVENSQDLKILLRAGQLCSTAIISPASDDNSIRKVVGDPTEGALLIAAEKAGLTFEGTRSEFEELTEFSFDSKRKRMTTIVRDKSGQIWAFSKGAPEIILERTTRVFDDGDVIQLSSKKQEEIQSVNRVMASCAMRVLALAFKKIDSIPDEWKEEEVERELVFLGLVGMIDPPRDGVLDSIKIARKAGIRPIMITGDHSLTASSIAKSVGLIQSEREAVTGTELNAMSDDELDIIIAERDVFARVAPEHKLRIINALKRQNQVVAMTGDGVNDAPAIKKADVGISMGIRGAGVTKEASDLILTDDNFSTIVSAIEVGREIYANIRKFVRFLLSANAGEILIIFIMVMIGLPIPLTPVMILWINLVTDGPPALALGFDPPPKGIMDRCPRKPGARMMDKGMIRIIIIGGILATFAASVVYLYLLWIGIGHIPGITGPAVDWSMPQYSEILMLAQTGTFATMVLFQLLWVWNVRDEWNPIWRTNMRESRSLLIAVAFSFILTLLVLYTPISIAFGTKPLSLDIWILMIGLCLIGFLAPVYRLLPKESNEICDDDSMMD